MSAGSGGGGVYGVVGTGTRVMGGAYPGGVLWYGSGYWVWPTVTLSGPLLHCLTHCYTVLATVPTR